MEPNNEAKRGPGRPRREAVNVDGLSAIDANLGVVVSGKLQPITWKRVKITHYKVHTPHGRFIAGDFATLPEEIADALIAEGKAK